MSFLYFGMNQISILFNSISKSLASIGRYGLFSYFLLSGLIAFLLFILIGGFSWYIGGILGDQLLDFIPWISEKLGGAGKWTGRLLSIGLGLILYKYILLIATGPLMGKLSEKIESNIAPNLGRLNVNFVETVYRGIKFSLRGLFFEIILTLVVVLIGIIPFVGILSVPLLFLVQSYYAGAGNMDLTLERFLTIKESVKFNRKYRLLTIGYGAIYLTILFIPILGLFLSPVLSTLLSTHGTLAILKQENTI